MGHHLLQGVLAARGSSTAASKNSCSLCDKCGYGLRRIRREVLWVADDRRTVSVVLWVGLCAQEGLSLPDTKAGAESLEVVRLGVCMNYQHLHYAWKVQAAMNRRP